MSGAMGEATAADVMRAGARRGRFLQGMRDCTPVVMGYIAIGLAFGVVARTAGMHVPEVTLLSLILYAGSAQFVVAGMLAAGAAPLAIVITVFLVNARHLLYSAAMAPLLRTTSAWRNMIIGAELTDETFTLATSLVQRGRPANHAWMLGINVTAQVSWVAATTLGAILGQAVGDVRVLGLDFALTAMYAALLILQMVDRPQVRIGIVVATLGAVIGVGGALVVSASWAIVIATIVASSAGLAMEGRSAWK